MSGPVRPEATGAGPLATEELPSGTGALGLKIFLTSLGMLFGATLTGYLVIRSRAPHWPPEGVPHLPRILVLSTLLIIVSSFTAQWALRAARSERAESLHRAVLTTFVLGVVFLVLQAFAWFQMAPAVEQLGAFRPPALPGTPVADPAPRQFAFLFYTLTVLHALHVLGGLVAFALLLNPRFAFRRPRLVLRRVRHAAVYWHFLDAVWVVMYVVLLI